VVTAFHFFSIKISILPLKTCTFLASTSCVEEFHSLKAQCVKNCLRLFALNLPHLNFTWLPLALVLEGILDSWSLLPFSTQLLLHACIIPPLRCTFCRPKTPSLSSSFYKIISLPLIILTTPVPFPFYCISSDTDQPEPQKEFEAGATRTGSTLMFPASTKWWEVLAAEYLWDKTQWGEEQYNARTWLWKTAMLEQSQSSILQIGNVKKASSSSQQATMSLSHEQPSCWRVKNIWVRQGSSIVRGSHALQLQGQNQLSKEFKAVMKRNIRGLSARPFLSNLNIDPITRLLFWQSQTAVLKSIHRLVPPLVCGCKPRFPSSSQRNFSQMWQ